MRTLMKALLASAALAGLAGCASYDYGYAYEQPYYGYGYGPYYYDYGYPYYGPAYYYGGPTVGFDFRFRDRDRFDHRGRFDRHERAAGRTLDRDRAHFATRQQAPHPARVNQPSNQPRAGSLARQRASTARATAPRAPQVPGERRPAPATMRAEQ